MESNEPNPDNLNRKGRKMQQKKMEKYAKYVNKKIVRDRKKREAKKEKIKIIYKQSEKPSE